jgi:ABC-type multidrug transport system fused ATPase/permease subunit
VLVLSQGRIIERGTHAALIDRGGAYARMSHQLLAGSNHVSLV